METLCNTGNTRIKSLLKNTAFAIIPIMNPSGRARTDSAAGKGGDLDGTTRTHAYNDKRRCDSL